MSDIDDYKSRFLRLVELRDEQDFDSAKAKKSKAAYDAYEAELYADLVEAGMGSQTLDFGGDLGKIRFTPRKPTIYGQIIDPEVALKSLKEAGRDDAIVHTSIRKGRLNEYVRDIIESRGDLPDGIGYYDDKGITISRKG